MKVTVAKRDYNQKAFNLELKITFQCCRCKKEVVPDELIFGRAHVYALHCELMQDIGLVA